MTFHGVAHATPSADPDTGPARPACRTRVRQAAEEHGHRQVYYFRLQVRGEDESVFDATAVDYLPISDGQLHAWADLYQLWFPVRLDPRDRTSAKILWRAANSPLGAS